MKTKPGSNRSRKSSSAGCGRTPTCSASICSTFPKLPQSAVANGRLFANRVEALSFFPQGQTVAEVGTQAGWYAERMIGTIKPRELHLFDLDFDLLQTERPEIAQRPEVTLHEGDSSQKLAALPDKYFDLIYIDGDHEIVGVIKDTNVALEKVRDDGIWSSTTTRRTSWN